MEFPNELIKNARPVTSSEMTVYCPFCGSRSLLPGRWRKCVKCSRTFRVELDHEERQNADVVD